MLAKTRSYALNGVDGYAVGVEVDLNAGLPSYDTVGLADTSVKESRERVRSAIKNSLLRYPLHKIVINLAPADSKKEGSHFDLAIAVAILAASEQLEGRAYQDYVFLSCRPRTPPKPRTSRARKCMLWTICVKYTSC